MQQSDELSSHAARPARTLCFDVFEIDLRNRELWRGGVRRGVRVKLQQKPFQILCRLLEAQGELVTRLELAKHLWPELHVVFEGSLNTAVNALRRALGDPPRNPRYIETRPGIGYRFIAPVKPVDEVRPVHPAAHQDCLKGRYFYNKMTEEDLRKSVAYFEAALSADADYAPAYAGLADTHALFAFLGIAPARDALRRANEFAQAALRIDDTLAEAHVALAGVKKLYHWDWSGAEGEYQKALRLNPNYARGHQLYAGHLSAMGRPEEALQEIRRALELDPLSLVVNMEMAWMLYMARDFQGAVEQSWRTLTMDAKFAPAQNTLGLAYEQLGMQEEGIVELQNARACSGDHPATEAALGHAYARAGRLREAEEALQALQRRSQTRFVSPYWLSILHVALGEYAPALDLLEQAQQDRDVWLVWLKVEPRFDPLRGNPRFKALLRGMGW
jgi:DNA-binding winged helix-turn-helix (wHTH) protein/Flp pilus assembly protein TadD